MGLTVKGGALYVQNRELVATRLQWPGDVLNACVQAEQHRPGWWVWWQDGRGRHPAGFSATRHNGHVRVCARTIDGLMRAMDRAPEDQHWTRARFCCEEAS